MAARFSRRHGRDGSYVPTSVSSLRYGRGRRALCGPTSRKKPWKIYAVWASTCHQDYLSIRPRCADWLIRWRRLIRGGWDAALCHQLQRLGVNPRILPTDEELKEVRALSHRRTAKELLDSIHNTSLINNTIEDSIKATEEAIEKTSKTIELVGETIEATREAIELTGEAIEVKDEAALLQQLARWPEAVLKAPWSSSGRGVRMVSAPLHSSVLQWALGVMRRQGSLMVEPLYHKVADFGMEFSANAEGFTYLGLSLFDTSGTAYTGNLLATEEEKRAKLARYLSPTQIDSLRQLVLHCLKAISPRFRLGPFGIDMMIVRKEDGKTRVHPCVEINFRRTMGHVAIALQQRITTPAEAMAVTFEDGHYHLRCR